MNSCRGMAGLLSKAGGSRANLLRPRDAVGAGWWPRLGPQDQHAWLPSPVSLRCPSLVPCSGALGKTNQWQLIKGSENSLFSSRAVGAGRVRGLGRVTGTWTNPGVVVGGRQGVCKA